MLPLPMTTDLPFHKRILLEQLVLTGLYGRLVKRSQRIAGKAYCTWTCAQCHYGMTVPVKRSWAVTRLPTEVTRYRITLRGQHYTMCPRCCTFSQNTCNRINLQLYVEQEYDK